MKLLRQALQTDLKLDYFHLISGHDYPCKSNEKFDNFFEEHAPLSYMYFDTDEEVLEWRKEKYPVRTDKWYFHDAHWHPFVKHIASAVLNRIIRRAPLPNTYAGWNWFSWHRNVAVWVMDYMDKHPDYLHRFRHTSCCDEIVFHTLLYDYLQELMIEPDNSLRYIDWHPSRPSETLPLVLDERDYDMIVSSGAFFCRKVKEETSAGLMNKLDHHSMAQANTTTI